MNYIPHIEYTEIGTAIEKEFTFDCQPEKDPFNEKITVVAKGVRSSNGVQQTEFNYIIKQYTMKFLFQPRAVYDSFIDFIEYHAYRGGTFKYYPSSDEEDYEIFELASNSVSIERPTFGESDFNYSFSFSIERVVDTVLELETGESGVGAISETGFELINNQSSPADITSLYFDVLYVRAAYIDYTIYRNTTGAGATELSEVGELRLVYNSVAVNWDIDRSAVGDAGVTITVTNAGQLQYTSTNITGTPSISVIRFKARTLSQET
jgi:hypothetical protein